MKRGTLMWVVLVLCLLPMLRTGNEIDEQVYVVTIGIDAQSDGRLRVAMQLPSGSAADVGSDDQETPASPYTIIQTVASSLTDAFNLFNATVPRRLNYSQVRLIIFDENLARSAAFGDIMDGITLLPGLRLTATCLVSRDPALEFLKNNKPVFGLRLSKYLEIALKDYNEQSGIPVTMVGELRRLLKSDYRDSALTYAGTNTFDNQQPVPPGRPLDVMPGNLPRIGSNPNELLGAALFNHGQMVCALTGMETQMMDLMQGSINNMFYQVDGAYYHVSDRISSQLNIEWAESGCTLTVNASITCFPLGLAMVDATRVKESLEAECTLLLQKLKNYRVDPLGFGGIAARRVWTMEDWDNDGWRQIYHDADVRVQIDVTVREEG